MTSPLTRPASLLLAAATLSASASAQFNFDECGTLVNDTIAQCVVFEADNGGTYLPSTSLGGLVIGDRVRAQGDVTGNFFTICGGTFSGLLLNETWTLAPQCNVVSDPITIFCDPASQHHEGAYVSLDPSTFGSGVGSDLHIEAINGPVDEFGFVIMSSDGSANLNIFNGVLCLGNPQGRYNPQVATNQALPQLNSLGQFDGAGVLQNMSGTSGAGSGFDVPTELPFSPAGQIIAPGDVYFFQVWYRDLILGIPSANFSNTIEVEFP